MIQLKYNIQNTNTKIQKNIQA